MPHAEPVRPLRPPPEPALPRPEDARRPGARRLHAVSQPGLTLHALRQSVVDARAAVDWLESRGYTKLAVLGTSIGSCIALITLAHDARLKAGVMNHVSPYFADVVWQGISTRHVRAGLQGKIGLEDLRRIWMPISPKPYFRKLAGTGKKSFLVHALYDYTFPHPLSLEVLRDYRELRLPHASFALRCGHYTSGVFPFNIVPGIRHVQVYPQKPLEPCERFEGNDLRAVGLSKPCRIKEQGGLPRRRRRKARPSYSSGLVTFSACNPFDPASR